MKFRVLLYALLLMTWHTAQAQQRQIRIVDIWNGQPIPRAQLVIGNDTLRASATGILTLGSCPAGSVVSIGSPGYFTEKVPCEKIRETTVYLIPIEQTPFITVVRSPIPSQPLNIPSHQTHLAINPSTHNGQSLADLLQMQSGVFVKPYGPAGGLETIAIRGMAAEQTQISFDGIPMNNLQLGSVDLSFFPLADLSGVDLYRGSNVILGGSGAIGGSINLKPLKPSRHLKVLSRLFYSALENKQVALQFHLPLHPLQGRSLLLLNHANGLNRYSAIYQGRKVPLRDRDFRQTDLSYQILLSPLAHSQIKFFIRHFKRHAGAPKAFDNPNSEAANRARISSDNTLAYLRWQYETPRLGYSTLLYVRNEWMNYYDPGLSLNFVPLRSTHFDKEQGLQVRFHYSPRQAFLFKSGVEMANQAIVSSDAGKHKRQRQAFYLLADWLAFEKTGTLQAFHLNAGFRIEHYNAYAAVVLPAIGANYNYRRFQIYANIGRNFRIPGFNDLYWQPGGNPHLKPEFSRNREIGIRQNFPLSHWLGQLEISAYQNTVRDQIRWLPGKAGYWTPENIRAVESQGVELDVGWAYMNNVHQIHFSYGFGKTLKKKPEIENDRTVGNQLPFLPQEQWALRVQSGWKKWRLGLQVQHTGFRFTDFSNDPNNILPSFTTARVWLKGKVSWGNLRFLPGVAVENLTNRSYEVLKGFPMPGRYVTLNCSIIFSKGNGKEKCAAEQEY